MPAAAHEIGNHNPSPAKSRRDAILPGVTPQLMKKIKSGIIGTGFIGPAHVEAVRRLGFVEMNAVCEANETLAAAKATQMSIPKSYGSVDAFLADPEIKVVHNCTPNHLHFEISKKI